MTPDDLEWCHALNQHNVPALGTETADDFARLLDIAAVAVVAEVDGDRAGFAISMIEGTDYASVNYRWFAERWAAFVYLDRVAVADTHKGL
ncbi:MAG: GNAT family N-acetyltransferase, partial [Ilumatobacteraceae bacterium]